MNLSENTIPIRFGRDQRKTCRPHTTWTMMRLLIALGMIGATSVAGSLSAETAGDIYWTSSELLAPGGPSEGRIHRADLDGSNVEDLVVGLARPFGVGLAFEQGDLFWADRAMNQIFRSDLDGTDIESVFSGPLAGPVDLELDPEGGKIYWTNEDGLEGLKRASLDGSDVETLHSGIGTDVELDLVHDKVYWIGTAPYVSGILRSDSDGSNLEEVITGAFRAIALDPFSSTLFWTESTESHEGPGRIWRAEVTTAGELMNAEIIGATSGRPGDIDFARGKIYWAESDFEAETGRISRANPDGSDVSVLVSGIRFPNMIAVNVASDEVCICHFPPGNPGNSHTICIPSKAADAHFKKHGDTLGRCEF